MSLTKDCSVNPYDSIGYKNKKITNDEMKCRS